MNNQQQSSTFIDNQLWSVERLSKYLDVPIATVRHWVHQRLIPFIKVGRHIRFRFDPDILKWLEERSKGCPLR